MDPIERAVTIPKPIEITYRQVLVPADDLTAPGEIGVEFDGLTLSRVNVTALRVTGTAGFDDDLNTPVALAVLVWYIAAAEVLNHQFGRTLLPLGHIER